MNMRNENGPRIRIGNLTIDHVQRRNRKLIVFRNDKNELPHLTISWQNASKEIDIHLTKRTSGGIENHQPIATIPESVLKKVCESFGAEILKVITLNIEKVRKVRPGWLARNGHTVLYLPNDMQEQLIRKLAPKQKHRGKWTYKVDKDVILGNTLPQEIIDGLYHPSMLHKLAELNYREPVFAASARRKCKDRLIALMLITDPNGRFCWVRIDNLAKKMIKLEKLMISSLRTVLPNNAWATINGELLLDELGFES